MLKPRRAMVRSNSWPASGWQETSAAKRRLSQTLLETCAADEEPGPHSSFTRLIFFDQSCVEIVVRVIYAMLGESFCSQRQHDANS